MSASSVSAPVSAPVVSAFAAPEAGIYVIPESKLRAFEVALARIGRKARKLGFEAPGFVVGKTVVRSISLRMEHDGPSLEARLVICREVTLTGAPTVVLDGWSFVATLEHISGDKGEGTLVHTLPGESVPQRFHSARGECGHCKASRNRNETFVLRHEDGTYIQVGRQCVEDFLGGHSAELVAQIFQSKIYANDLAKSFADPDGWLSGNSGGSPRLYADLSAFMPLAAQIVLEHGYVTRAASENSGGTVRATADRASDAYYGRGEAVEVTEEAEALADRALEWAKGLSDEAVAGSEYMHNVREMAVQGVLSTRHIGLAASIITAYQKAVAPKFGEGSTYVGAVGDKLTVALTVHRVTEVSGFGTYHTYTPAYLHIMCDAAGNVFTWKASGTKLDEGKAYVLRGTVKRHSDYKGTAQTVLTRCSEVSYRRWAVECKGESCEVEAEDERGAKEAFKSQKGLARLPRGVTVRAL
jgi:hypothetical protein